MSEPMFPSRILPRFVQAATEELGTDQFNAVLALTEIPVEWMNPSSSLKMDFQEAARAYASLQTAMRTYYGRGGRGTLLRVGQRLWHLILDDAALSTRAQAALIRRLPLQARRKPALDLLSRLLSAQPGDISIHTLDLDLILEDHASPTTQGIQSDTPICFVTQGLILESLLWATGQRHDVEENSCKARGDHNCEFRVVTEK